MSQSMSNKRIMIIEDDEAIAMLVSDNLQFEGFTVECCDSGAGALAAIGRFAPDLILLDLMLPKGPDGFQLCRTLTQSSHRTPVIIMTARAQQEDRVRGLTMGADDYVVKPFALEELLARVHAVLRRAQPRVDHLRLGDTVIDFRQLRALRDGRDLSLTDREYEILRHLAERAGHVVSRDELLHLVWGYSEAPPMTRTVDNFIFRLRLKIEPDPRHPRYIRTAYGGGYRLTLSDDSDLTRNHLAGQ